MELSPPSLGLVSSLALLALVFFLMHVCYAVLLKSERIKRKLRMQGIQGPPPSFLYGNLPAMQKIQLNTLKASSFQAPDFIAHDYTSTVFPYFEQWRKEYGPVYTYSTGLRQHLYVNEPELVKEMNQMISLDLGKPSYLTKRMAPLLGSGIVRSNGLVWAQQRKIVAPEFYMDKVKGMVGLMVEAAQPLLKKWEEYIEAQGGITADVKVDEDLRELSAVVISRACFGSSYSKGKQIFSKLRSLQQTFSSQNILFGTTNFGFLPVKKKSKISNLEREVESLIWEAVKERQQECQETNSREKDLMLLLLEGAINDQSLGKDASKSFVVDNCKTIYFAGHESTAVAASWCLMLLALHPEWQVGIRRELAEISKDGLLSVDSLHHHAYILLQVTMVIQEALRLYPPAAFVSREALEDTKLGNIVVSKGVCLWTLIPTLHRDPAVWGSDANEFKPERFARGVSKACKYPQAYIPFGVGPRLCLGKNFAMVELKVVLSLIVSKFSFSLSPKYHHSPAYRMIVEPGDGVQILIQKI